MQFADITTVGLTMGAPLLIAIALLLTRAFVMGRAQEKRQRANRQQTERLKSLVSAYRTLAGSFRPLREGEIIEPGDHAAVEAALSDILLFGSAAQVAMASECAQALVQGAVPPLAPLVADLRRDLRTQLGLAPLDSALELPAPGPLRGRRQGKGDTDGKTNETGREGAGGGLLMGGGLSGGLRLEDDEERSRLR